MSTTVGSPPLSTMCCLGRTIVWWKDLKRGHWDCSGGTCGLGARTAGRATSPPRSAAPGSPALQTSTTRWTTMVLRPSGVCTAVAATRRGPEQRVVKVPKRCVCSGGGGRVLRLQEVWPPAAAGRAHGPSVSGRGPWLHCRAPTTRHRRGARVWRTSCRYTMCLTSSKGVGGGFSLKKIKKKKTPVGEERRDHNGSEGSVRASSCCGCGLLSCA